MSKIERLIDEALQEGSPRWDKDALYAATDMYDDIKDGLEPFESPEELLNLYSEFLKTILKSSADQVAVDIINNQFPFEGHPSDQLRNFLDFYAFQGEKIKRKGWKY